MADVLTLSDSPSANSRSSAVLAYVRQWLQQKGLQVEAVSVRDIPPDDLFHVRFDSPAVEEAVAKIQRAQAVVLATPVYKAAYTGVLKAFLDLLPQDLLVGKPILPIALGGSLAHLLVIEYALKPVLHALGADRILKGVYVVDTQVKAVGEKVQLDEEVEQRLQDALNRMRALLAGSELRL